LVWPYCQRFVFLRGHKEYALAAFGVHADGYLLKRVDKKEVLKEMAELERESNGVATDALMSHCLVVKNKGNKEQQLIAIADIISIIVYVQYANLLFKRRYDNIFHRYSLYYMDL